MAARKKSEGARYSVTLPPPLEADLDEVAANLHITKSEALRRALVLFKHAAQAEKVELTDPSGSKQTVLLK